MFTPFIAIVVYLIFIYSMVGDDLKDITIAEKRDMMVSVIATVIFIISVEVHYNLLLNNRSYIVCTMFLLLTAIAFTVSYVIDLYYLMHVKDSAISNAVFYTCVFSFIYLIYTVVQKYNSV